MEVPGLMEVLQRLAQGVGVGMVVAFLFERFRWFQNLTGNGRWWVVFGISFGLPMVATIALQFLPGEWWPALEMVWRIVAAGFLTWISSQVMHLVQTRLGGGQRRVR